MEGEKYLSVGKFAEISRTTRNTLRHYEKVGLLAPVIRGENKYRYYSIKQLAACNTIRILQKVGVPLAEIKNLLYKRTPELAQEVLTGQIKKLTSAQDNLKLANDLLNTILTSIQFGLSADHESITIQELPAEQIYLGDVNDYSDGKNDYDALQEFYKALRIKYTLSEYDVCYPVWGLFLKDRILRREQGYPDHYYLYHPKGPDQRPKATYAIGYTRGGYNGGVKLFLRMADYIEKLGYEICGNVYEEYPINEVCVVEENHYLLRLLITVQKKQ